MLGQVSLRPVQSGNLNKECRLLGEKNVGFKPVCVGTWNPTHLFVLHVGFDARINVTFGSDLHEGTQMCRLCRHKTRDTSDHMIDHGDKIVNETL